MRLDLTGKLNVDRSRTGWRPIVRILVAVLLVAAAGCGAVSVDDPMAGAPSPPVAILIDEVLDPAIIPVRVPGSGLGPAAPPSPPIRQPVAPLPVFTQLILVAADGQFLGNVNDNQFDLDSIANQFGTYGSRFNVLSIWNQFGTYGSNFSTLSPWNAFSTTPPCIYEDDACVLFVTAGLLQPSIHPFDLAIGVGRTDALR